MDKTLLIRTNETEPYKQLGWWNIDNIPDLEGLKFIFAHDGQGNVTGAYEVKTKSWENTKTGEWADIIVPYAVKVDRLYKKDKTGNTITKLVKRVNFLEYVNVREDFKTVKMPKTKQGQGYPLQVVDFDDTTNTIITKKRNRTNYTFEDIGLKSGDVIWFYQLDSCFVNKSIEPYKLIIENPKENTITDPKIKDKNRNLYKSINEFVYYKFEQNIKKTNENKQMNMNCRNWILTDEVKNAIPANIQNDISSLRKFISENGLYSLSKKL